jgi:hypothetical protein
MPLIRGSMPRFGADNGVEAVGGARHPIWVVCDRVGLANWTGLEWQHPDRRVGTTFPFKLEACEAPMVGCANQLKASTALWDVCPFVLWGSQKK